jgi:hypothetical protein
MARTQLPDVEPPRLLSESETAHHLGMSPSAFCRRAAGLEQLGLPKRHPILKRRDRIAIDGWLDGLFGVSRKAGSLSDLVRQRMGAGDGDGAH